MVEIEVTSTDIDRYKRDFFESAVLIRHEEAALVLAISPRTLHRRVEEGLIATYSDTKDRANIRYLASELRDYVKRMRTIHRDR